MNGRRRRPHRAAVASSIVVSLVALVACGGDEERGADTATCTPSPSPEQADQSVARLWNEAILEAIRSDFPAPTVHARNLFHASAAMWDAWAAYDEEATGVFVDEDLTAATGNDAEALHAARAEAMSYAAYRILVERYLPSPDAEAAVTRLDELMAALCYDTTVDTTVGDEPAALGNRIADTVLAHGLADGANEAGGYVDPDYVPVNPPLVVDRPGTAMVDPNRWQPLELEVMVAQNGLPLDDTVQTFVGPHWGWVESFALPPADADGLTIDPGPPPMLGDDETDREFKLAVNEVIRYSATLDPGSGATIDLSPATRGNTPLGSYDGSGHAVNPVTGEAYPANVVAHGDYGRIVAEYWADGPRSETPPGHWNAIANEVSDSLAALEPLRVGGGGEPVDRLEWDVKLYLAINGAAHDAAIAAWGAKGHYDYVRPISMIRHLGGLGQSSDPDGPAYDPDGLLLEPGLVEVVTETSSATGERHAHLADHVGEIAILSWQGVPADIETDIGGVGWIRAAEWTPYQMPTFVTPSFAAYVSGHSTFSRAAAEVLTAMTGSAYFPSGLGERRRPAGSLEFEAGPTDDVVLQWATYADAADEAGVSRLYGGIHVRADDLAGRQIGAEVGPLAWARAVQYFGVPIG